MVGRGTVHGGVVPVGLCCTCSQACSFARDTSPQKGKKLHLFKQEELCCHSPSPEMVFRSLGFFPEHLGEWWLLIRVEQDSDSGCSSAWEQASCRQTPAQPSARGEREPVIGACLMWAGYCEAPCGGMQCQVGSGILTCLATRRCWACPWPGFMTQDCGWWKTLTRSGAFAHKGRGRRETKGICQTARK